MIKNIFLKSSLLGKISAFILFLFIVLALIGLFLPEKLYKIPSGGSLQTPNSTHILGTDDMGIDILYQLCSGTSISLLIGLSTAFLAGFGGSIIGIFSAFSSKKVDLFISGVCDLFLTIPHFPLLIVFGMFLGAGVENIIIAITLLYWVEPAKIIRGKVLSLKNENFIIISKNYGASFLYLIFKHILPNVFPIIIINMVKIINKAVIMEASLTFLGLGDPTTKSWGIILNHAMTFSGIYYTPFWQWWIVPPMVLIILFVLAMSWVALEVENLLDIKKL